MQLNAEQKKSKNLKMLQTNDSFICDTLDEAAHVEIYKFDPSSGKWEKFGCSGSAFVVKRNITPAYQLFVLNKQGIHIYIVLMFDDNRGSFI